jgi:hypothetical protein
MKNTLLEELLALGIQARIDRITERLGHAALGVQPISAERETKLKDLHAALVELQFMHASADSEVTIEQRVRAISL